MVSSHSSIRIMQTFMMTRELLLTSAMAKAPMRILRLILPTTLAIINMTASILIIAMATGREATLDLVGILSIFERMLATFIKTDEHN